MKEIKVLNNCFKYYEEDSLWLSYLGEVTFEIYSKDLDVDFTSEILTFFTSKKNNLFELDCKELLINLSNKFWRNTLLNPIFNFSGIVVYDKKNEIDFQMIFDMSSDCDNFGSDYANWVVNVKDYRIVGVFRKQL